MNYKVGGNAEECGKMWTNVFAQADFRPGDIFAPQDCVGAGGLNLDNLWEWFSNLKKAVNTKPGLKFWGNVETFDQRFWTSAPLERVQKQLEIVNGYVGNLICFAYNHYNSPFVVNPAYHQAYLQYCRTGCLPIMDIPEKVKNAAVRKVAKGIEVSWIPNEMKAVDGYSIYRDGQLIMKLQIRDGQLPRTFVDAEGTVDNVYEVAVYNVIGKESAKVKAE